MGILPTRVAQKFSARGLRVVENAPKVQDKIALIYRADSQSTTASRQLARFISEELQRKI